MITRLSQKKLGTLSVKQLAAAHEYANFSNAPPEPDSPVVPAVNLSNLQYCLRSHKRRFEKRNFSKRSTVAEGKSQKAETNNNIHFKFVVRNSKSSLTVKQNYKLRRNYTSHAVLGEYEDSFAVALSRQKFNKNKEPNNINKRPDIQFQCKSRSRNSCQSRSRNSCQSSKYPCKLTLPNKFSGPINCKRKSKLNHISKSSSGSSSSRPARNNIALGNNFLVNSHENRRKPRIASLVAKAKINYFLAYQFRRNSRGVAELNQPIKINSILKEPEDKSSEIVALHNDQIEDCRLTKVTQTHKQSRTSSLKRKHEKSVSEQCTKRVKTRSQPHSNSLLDLVPKMTGPAHTDIYDQKLNIQNDSSIFFNDDSEDSGIEIDNVEVSGDKFSSDNVTDLIQPSLGRSISNFSVLVNSSTPAHSSHLHTSLQDSLDIQESLSENANTTGGKKIKEVNEKFNPIDCVLSNPICACSHALEIDEIDENSKLQLSDNRTANLSEGLCDGRASEMGDVEDPSTLESNIDNTANDIHQNNELNVQSNNIIVVNESSSDSTFTDLSVPSIGLDDISNYPAISTSLVDGHHYSLLEKNNSTSDHCLAESNFSNNDSILQINGSGFVVENPEVDVLLRNVQEVNSSGQGHGLPEGSPGVENYELGSEILTDLINVSDFIDNDELANRIDGDESHETSTTAQPQRENYLSLLGENPVPAIVPTAILNEIESRTRTNVESESSNRLTEPSPPQSSSASSNVWRGGLPINSTSASINDASFVRSSSNSHSLDYDDSHDVEYRYFMNYARRTSSNNMFITVPEFLFTTEGQLINSLNVNTFMNHGLHVDADASGGSAQASNFNTSQYRGNYHPAAYGTYRSRPDWSNQWGHYNYSRSPNWAEMYHPSYTQWGNRSSTLWSAYPSTWPPESIWDQHFNWPRGSQVSVPIS